jgi:NAD-dependent SIR2 family protein deacetylase
MELKCEKCGESTKKLQLHHLIPRSLGGTDMDGRIWLCEKCHSIIHLMMPKIIFDGFVYPLKKYECREFIKKKTLLICFNGRSRWVELSRDGHGHGYDGSVGYDGARAAD